MFLNMIMSIKQQIINYVSKKTLVASDVNRDQKSNLLFLQRHNQS